MGPWVAWQDTTHRPTFPKHKFLETPEGELSHIMGFVELKIIALFQILSIVLLENNTISVNAALVDSSKGWQIQGPDLDSCMSASVCRRSSKQEQYEAKFIYDVSTLTLTGLQPGLKLSLFLSQRGFQSRWGMTVLRFSLSFRYNGLCYRFHLQKSQSRDFYDWMSE